MYETHDGFTIKYAHLSEFLVEENEIINQHQVIAKSGSTGLATGAHLHYGIIYNGEYIDPLIYLTLPYTQEVRDEYIERNTTLAKQ